MRGGAATTRQVGQQHALDAYNKRLDSAVAKLNEHYANILKSAKVGDKVKVLGEEFQVDVQTSNLVTAAESLLTLISELKQAVLLHDFETRNAEVTTRAQQYRDRQDKTKKARVPGCVLQTLHREVQDALLELSEEYVDR
ncbi:Surfeit locus protein 5 [Acanthamoeba castellanii str. Neff]|uniref:Surfeit locus protein 5 n=1 Tax=Acanthamoeba castellanii (strain ATCC 30010 / Neff) TaxID=1257118 RepID=L8H3C8_ACACF|nr:Surfeit locus protein 5 [Acanthamoeba castellanii str. Neff]ELR18926.1 Surfeit locus protein 5 [Acanthamoeba castellanii str. Neff]